MRKGGGEKKVQGEEKEREKQRAQQQRETPTHAVFRRKNLGAAESRAEQRERIYRIA